MTSLESVLCTEELDRRPSRPPDYERENRALASLARALAESPRTILQTLADTILEVFEAGSAGISLVTEDEKRFHWPAIAGVWKPHIGGGSPRDFGPCGDVLDRNGPLLFRHPERRYTYFLPVTPAAEECLLVPFHVAGKAVGTIWALTHDDRRTFDREDLRILVSLGSFASAAYQAVEQLHALGKQAQEREEASRAQRDSHKLEALYEISKLFANFENVEQTFDPALAIAARSLPLRSAILIETENGRSTMLVWRSEGQNSEQLRAVKEHVGNAYRYLIGAASTESLDLREQAGLTALPPQVGTEGDLAKRLLVIPLVVSQRPVFGALQLEGARPLDKMDLMFVNAIANQLAVAIDRDRAWRQDITRREHAEEGRTDAEATSATAERGRVLAESSSEKYEALASENARLFAQAQQAVRVREQILAVVSHDLRNPLGAILLTTAALAKRGAPAEAVGKIQRGAESMVRLIEDLLDFASIETGSLSIKRSLEDPGPMIQETHAGFESVAEEKGLRLTANVETNLPRVNCDRGRILQVLSNLVGNATKATAAGGHITLRVEARGNGLVFAVADNGPGISEEDVKHLFERYWRSGEAEYKGTGLGLAIARGIVSAHDGRIWVESELGRGSTFLFTLPVADDA